MPWGACLFPGVARGAVRNISENLSHVGTVVGPAARGRRKTPGCLRCSCGRGSRDSPFVCHLMEGLAARASIQTLALTSCVILSSDVAAGQEWAGGAEGEPSRSSQETRCRLRPSRLPPQRPPLGEAAERGSRLAERLGDLLPVRCWRRGLVRSVGPREGRGGCCSHGITRGSCLATVPPVLCIYFSFMEFIHSAHFCGAATTCQALINPGKAQRTNRKIAERVELTF